MGTYVSGNGTITLRRDKLPDIIEALEGLGRDGDPARPECSPQAVVDLLVGLLPAEDDAGALIQDGLGDLYEGEDRFTVTISCYGKGSSEAEVAMKALAPFALHGEVDWQEHDNDSHWRDYFLNGLHREVSAELTYPKPEWPNCPRCETTGHEGLCPVCVAELAGNVPQRLTTLRERLTSAPAESEKA